jgi:hypothetical protein
MGGEGKHNEVGETLPVLVVREVQGRMTLSSAVSSKIGLFIARRVGGQCDVIAQSDQEPAITSIATEVGKVCAAEGGGREIVEASPVGREQWRGGTGHWICRVAQQIRVPGAERRIGLQSSHQAYGPSPDYDLDYQVCYPPFEHI